MKRLLGYIWNETTTVPVAFLVSLLLLAVSVASFGWTNGQRGLIVLLFYIFLIRSVFVGRDT